MQRTQRSALKNSVTSITITCKDQRQEQGVGLVGPMLYVDGHKMGVANFSGTFDSSTSMRLSVFFEGMHFFRN